MTIERMRELDANNWLLIETVRTDDLTQSVMARVARQADIVLGDQNDAYRLYDCVAWLTEGWPKDEGFGSSDSYQCLQDALKAFGKEN